MLIKQFVCQIDRESNLQWTKLNCYFKTKRERSEREKNPLFIAYNSLEVRLEIIICSQHNTLEVVEHTLFMKKNQYLEHRRKKINNCLKITRAKRTPKFALFSLPTLSSKLDLENVLCSHHYTILSEFKKGSDSSIQWSIQLHVKARAEWEQKVPYIFTTYNSSPWQYQCINLKQKKHYNLVICTYSH